MDFVVIGTVIKNILELIRSAVTGWEVQKDSDHRFVLKQIVEPIHQSMCLVHGIYMSVFPEAEKRIRAGDTSLQQLLQFLADRDFETHLVRDNLHGLVTAARARENLPKSVLNYLSACQKYFGYATGVGVRSRMRALLHKLRALGNIAELQQSAIEEPENYYPIQFISDDVVTSIAMIPVELRKIWPEVMETYHAAHLELVEKHRQYWADIGRNIDWEQGKMDNSDG